MTQLPKKGGIKSSPETETAVIKLYKSGTPIKEIITKTAVNNSTVFEILKRNEVPRRRRGTPFVNQNKKAADPKTAAKRKRKREAKKSAPARMCSCCGLRPVKPPNRFLCVACWRHDGFNYL